MASFLKMWQKKPMFYLFIQAQTVFSTSSFDSNKCPWHIPSCGSHVEPSLNCMVIEVRLPDPTWVAHEGWSFMLQQNFLLLNHYYKMLNAAVCNPQTLTKHLPAKAWVLFFFFAAAFQQVTFLRGWYLHGFPWIWHHYQLRLLYCRSMIWGSYWTHGYC